MTLVFGWSGCTFRADGRSDSLMDSGYVFLRTDSCILIDKVGNYRHLRKPFSLSSTQSVKVSACGEILIGLENGKRDVFEIYVDLLDRKQIQFDSKHHKFLFFSELGGSSDGAEVVFSSTGEDSYNIEIAYPWNRLGVTPVIGKSLGFDFAFSDNDDGFIQDKQIAWHADDSDIWLDPRLWGQLQLVDNAGPQSNNDSIVYSSHQSSRPVLDGKMDACWQNVQKYSADKILYGDVSEELGNSDISVCLRSVWDMERIYFWVEVKDDKVIKRSTMGKVFDHGWIETASGQVIWDMNRSNGRHSGGALKNACADTTMTLAAGNYYLCYQSDEGHAFGMWDDKPPNRDLYGIEIRF